MENKKTILTLVICLILVGIGTIINNLVFKTEDKIVDKIQDDQEKNDFVKYYSYVNKTL